MTKKEFDRIGQLEAKWLRLADRYKADVAANRLQMLSIKEVVEEVRFLIDKARDNPAVPAADAECLHNLDIEFQELEQSSLRAIDANKRLPAGIGRLVGIVKFLLKYAKPVAAPAEPATL